MEDTHHGGPTATAPAEDYIARYEAKTPGSRALHERSRRYTPGGISHNNRYYPPYPIYFSRAHGCRLWDVDGNEYLDLWMAHYDAILGHAPKAVVSRVREAMENGLHVGLAMEHEIELAQRVCDLMPAAEQVRFCASGTEATMYAVRLARGFTGRNVILKMVGGWHGANTDLMVDIAPPEFIGAEGRGLPPDLTRYTRSAQLNDIEDTARAIREAGDDWAGIILEPAMGAGGFIPVEQDYLAFIKEEAKKAGALIIFDEVITGFRLALGGAQEYFDFTPDLVTLGKVLGGGMPVGAVAGREDVLAISSVEAQRSKADKLVIGGGTYSCNPLTMIAGAVTLDILKEKGSGFYAALEGFNTRLCQGIRAAFEHVAIPVHVNQVGSLQEVHFLREPGLPVRNMADVVANTVMEKRVELATRLRNQGVFIFHGGALSAAHSGEDVELIVAAYARCAAEMAG
ncbi:MAG: aspartate aminotransferase family protein [bacterium]